jgi:hypothetical protein
MTLSTKTRVHIVLAGVVGVGGLLLSDNISLTKPESFVATANGRIGRPATPMSYAGVARRTHRRAVYGTAAVGAAAYGAYRRSGCVNAYGQVVYQCP